MDRPQLSIICPTVGRSSLSRTLRSLLLQQSSLTYEIVVVGDSHSGTWRAQLDQVHALLSQLISEFRLGLDCFQYHEHDGGLHMVGHPQRNHGATVARGCWLWWLGDDDVALPSAFEAIRNAIGQYEPTPFLFRWIAPWKQILWHTPGVVGDAPGHIDAECIVAPNVPEKLGVWENRFQGDWDFITQTIAKWDGNVVFRPEVIAQARPSEAEDWTKRAKTLAGVAG